MDNSFDVEAVLSKTTFTVPVTVEDRDDKGKITKRQIRVTYHFDDDTRQAQRDGVMESIEVPNVNQATLQVDTEAPTKTIEERRDLNSVELLTLMVKSVEGVSEVGEAFWKGVPPKHQQAILTAVMKDIYPNAKISIA